jgi:hypothetical protein
MGDCGEAASKAQLRDLFSTQLASQCKQVPVRFSPAKHRSTQIDTEKVLQGTSDTPAALAGSICGAGAAVKPHSSNELHSLHSRPCRHGAAAGRPHVAAGAPADAPPCTLYQSEHSAAAGNARPGPLLQHSPCKLAAARRTLEASSEWAELSRAEQERLAQEVRHR